jgi:hypothetical protein
MSQEHIEIGRKIHHMCCGSEAIAIDLFCRGKISKDDYLIYSNVKQFIF